MMNYSDLSTRAKHALMLLGLVNTGDEYQWPNHISLIPEDGESESDFKKRVFDVLNEGAIKPRHLGEKTKLELEQYLDVKLHVHERRIVMTKETDVRTVYLGKGSYDGNNVVHIRSKNFTELMNQDIKTAFRMRPERIVIDLKDYRGGER